jgi:hypothetical protein
MHRCRKLTPLRIFPAALALRWMIETAGPRPRLSAQVDRTGYAFSWSSNALASFKSAVSKPSVNQL